MSSGRRHGPSLSTMLVMVTSPISTVRMSDSPFVSVTLFAASKHWHIFFRAFAEHQAVFHIFHSYEARAHSDRIEPPVGSHAKVGSPRRRRGGLSLRGRDAGDITRSSEHA